MTTDGDNVQHLEECPGCMICERLLEFYMTCDGCGSWGNKESAGFEMVQRNGVDMFYCWSCRSANTQEGE